ncbi:hypothetical protein MBLNU13_g00165t2 [Cladosporium sp. NU13]
MALGSLRKFEADEYVMIATLLFFTVIIATINIVESTSSNLLPPGYDVEHMTQEDIKERTLGSKLVLLVEQCQIMVIWATKACLLIMYIRFTTLRRENVAIKGIAVYVVVSFVVMEALYLGVWCRPFHNYWAVPTPNPQCNTASNHLITNAVFNISSDVLMLALGVPMFIRIQIPLSKKIPLVGIFSLGIFVIIAAVLNKWYSFTEPFGNAWTYWYVRESATAIIVANLPFVWLLYRRIFGIRTNSVTGSKTKSGHNTISLRSRAKSEVPPKTPRTFQDRRGSYSSEVAFGLGKSAGIEVTTTVTSEESRWDQCFDDKVANDSQGTRHLGLFHGQRPGESDGRQIHCMETAVLHDKKSAGSFV